MKIIRLFLFMGILVVLSFLQHPTFAKTEETDPLNYLQTFCNEVVRIDGTKESDNLLKELETVREQWKEIISNEETKEEGVEILINTIQACEKRTYAYQTAPFYLYQMLAQSKSPKAVDFLIYEANTPVESSRSLYLAREYLGDTGNERAFDFLRETSKGDTSLWSEQTATVKGLRKFGDRGVDVILAMIENKDLDKWGSKTSKNIWLFELGKSGSNKAALYLMDILNKEPGDSEKASTILSSLMMLSRGDIGRATTIENFLASYKNRPDLSEGNREQAEKELAEVQRIKGKMEEVK